MASAWTDVDWASHQRWAGSVNVVSIGEGPLVVFVHGLGGAWQNWLENLASVADAGYRALALDLPGFGASPLPAEPISIRAYAEVVLSLLDEPAVIVGNSMGGFVGCEAALREPSRVRGLMLVSPAGVSIQSPESARALGVVRKLQPALSAWSRVQSRHAVAVARRGRLRRGAMRLATSHPERLDPRLVAEHVRWADGPGYVGALDALTSYPLRERLSGVACPTLIIHGNDDRLVPVADADVFAAEIPHARRRIYPDTGHLAMLERPGRFNADLREFLGRLPDPAEVLDA